MISVCLPTTLSSEYVVPLRAGRVSLCASDRAEVRSPLELVLFSVRRRLFSFPPLRQRSERPEMRTGRGSSSSGACKFLHLSSLLSEPERWVLFGSCPCSDRLDTRSG